MPRDERLARYLRETPCTAAQAETLIRKYGSVAAQAAAQLDILYGAIDPRVRLS